MSKLSPEGGKLHDASLAEAKSLPEGLKKTFTQQELMKLGGIEGPSELMRVVQELVQHSLFRTLKADRTLLWSARPRDVASSLSALENDERLIYEAIENSDTTGIWLKKLKMSTGVAQANVPKIIKKLEGTHLVKTIRSVKNPAQRIYMLEHLQPGGEVTGGSFFDSGDLDEGLVDALAQLIIFHVQQQSWVEVKPRLTRERHSSPIELDGDDNNGGDANGNKKRKRTTADIEDAVPPKKRRPEFIITQAAYPAGSRSYPTIDDIHHFLTTADAIRSNKAASLTIREVQEIVNVLHWDGKLEKVANGYRTVLGVKHQDQGTYQYNEPGEDVGNGLTEAPCGRCPVFDICSDTGPVNPGSCVYFERWLKA